jgi:hypothetical protein
MNCPFCGKNIHDSMVISYSQTQLSAKARGQAKVRSHEVLARAARARWAKYWAERGGRPANMKPRKRIRKTAAAVSST